MTKQELEELQPGDVIVSRVTGITYTVMSNCGGRVLAAKVADVTNPDEWTVLPSRGNHAAQPA